MEMVGVGFYTTKHFADLASNGAIRITLVRLKQKGFTQRVSRGLYYYTKKHKILGVLPPKIEELASALSFKDRIIIQASGAYAANLLGLSEQVSSKYIFLTNGSSKKLKISEIELVFIKTTPKIMSLANTITGTIIQALKYIKKGNIIDEMISKIKNNLSKSDFKI